MEERSVVIGTLWVSSLTSAVALRECSPPLLQVKHCSMHVLTRTVRRKRPRRMSYFYKTHQVGLLNIFTVPMTFPLFRPSFLPPGPRQRATVLRDKDHVKEIDYHQSPSHEGRSRTVFLRVTLLCSDH